MSNFSFSIINGEPFSGIISLDKHDAESEIISREIVETLCLNDIISQNSDGRLSLGDFKIFLDFDINGELMNIQIKS
ncbi:hypothetical protein [Bartonella sp. HY761]|uniref:hypothetical protein n=1 Tax=Bartonella sp. HY761 TaxID=2979330 RepID=UPI00220758BC|nr:hypothetical protein [Bartonella sp. HY761]UXN06921.1 hypothetical protein N6A79_02615 [Bartonella sp. HY761]